jgi:hypothetical protein
VISEAPSLFAHGETLTGALRLCAEGVYHLSGQAIASLALGRLRRKGIRVTPMGEAPGLPPEVEMG